MAQPQLYATAREFACDAHEGQMYGDKPYITHVAAVVAVAREFQIDTLGTEFIPACYLHDVLEDTNTELEELEEMFGSKIAALVVAVTCVKGLSRKEKFNEVYPRIRSTKGAVLVKLADRIANVRASQASGGATLKMYCHEHADFREALYEETDKSAAPMWGHLDEMMKNML